MTTQRTKLNYLVDELNQLETMKEIYNNMKNADFFRVNGYSLTAFLNPHTIEFIKELIANEIKETLRQRKGKFDKMMDEVNI